MMTSELPNMYKSSLEAKRAYFEIGRLTCQILLDKQSCKHRTVTYAD